MKKLLHCHTSKLTSQRLIEDAIDTYCQMHDGMIRSSAHLSNQSSLTLDCEPSSSQSLFKWCKIYGGIKHGCLGDSGGKRNKH